MLPALVALALAADPAPPPEPVEYAAARLLARATGGEPDVREVQRAAREAAARDGAASFGARPRLAALVPRLTTEVRADDRRYRVVGLTATSEVDYVRDTPGTSVAVRLAWDLPHAVFADVELRVAAHAEAVAKRRADAVERATRLYYERQRLRLEVASQPGATARERAEQELRLEELAAELDALTGGLYARGTR